MGRGCVLGTCHFCMGSLSSMLSFVVTVAVLGAGLSFVGATSLFVGGGANLQEVYIIHRWGADVLGQWLSYAHGGGGSRGSLMRGWLVFCCGVIMVCHCLVVPLHCLYGCHTRGTHRQMPRYGVGGEGAPAGFLSQFFPNLLFWCLTAPMSFS